MNNAELEAQIRKQAQDRLEALRHEGSADEARADQEALRRRGPDAPRRGPGATGRGYQRVGSFEGPERNPFAGRDISELDRIVRTAALVHRFCMEIIDSFREQEIHRGQRSLYGLSKLDRNYAQAVLAWTDYHAELAHWMADRENRAAQARAAQAGLEVLADHEKARLGAKPRAPQIVRPESLATPVDWPPDPAHPDAVRTFFAARVPQKPRFA